MPSLSPQKSKNRAINKAQKRIVTYGWVKMLFLFITLIIIALGLGLIQSAMISKQAFFERLESYINFANPNYRFVYIYPGMRREEIVEKYSKILAWDDKDRRWFIASAPADPDNGGYMDGYFLAKTYFVEKDATGQEVGSMMHKEFLVAVSEEVLADEKPDIKGSGKKDVKEEENEDKKNTDKSSDKMVVDKKEKTIKDPVSDKTQVINLDTAITIASIIQREAAGPHDMNLISGIIWNRIFKGMSLELDATLQYAKGDEGNWWPQVTGKDKYIESPYNTYQNKGLPPGAISNPSIDAINAAYNPKKTDCIFYLHDKNRKIHCTKTYAEHKKNVDRYLR